MSVVVGVCGVQVGGRDRFWLVFRLGGRVGLPFFGGIRSRECGRFTAWYRPNCGLGFGRGVSATRSGAKAGDGAHDEIFYSLSYKVCERIYDVLFRSGFVDERDEGAACKEYRRKHQYRGKERVRAAMP